MPNIGSIISAHNAKILAPAANTTSQPACNCRNPNNCPIPGNCLAKCIVYKATITAPSKPVKTYFGLTEGDFKQRYNQHTCSFKHRSKSTDTELSKYMWELKDADIQGDISWSIAHRAAPYKCGSR